MRMHAIIVTDGTDGGDGDYDDCDNGNDNCCGNGKGTSMANVTTTATINCVCIRIAFINQLEIIMWRICALLAHMPSSGKSGGRPHLSASVAWAAHECNTPVAHCKISRYTTSTCGQQYTCTCCTWPTPRSPRRLRVVGPRLACGGMNVHTVSYTHLTLPTKRIV